MNAVTKQQLMDRVIRTIVRDSNGAMQASSNDLRKATESLASEVRRVERTFPPSGQAFKTKR